MECGTSVKHCLRRKFVGNLFVQYIARTNFQKSLENDCSRMFSKKAVKISNTSQNNNLIRNVFDAICKEKNNKTNVIPLDRKTCWSSLNYILERLKNVSSAVRMMPHNVLQEGEILKLDDT